MTVIQPALQGCIVGALACQNDSYLKTLESSVVSCTKAAPPPIDSKPKGRTGAWHPAPGPAPPDTWHIEFNDSVLFPEGGGQPTDYGTIVSLQDGMVDQVPIKMVERQGLRCVYHSPVPLKVGAKVRQEIDYRRRWDHMQQHTGQHLLSAVMDRYDNLGSVGWGMGTDGGMNYVDLPRQPTTEEIERIQDTCNSMIRDNLPITVDTPADANSAYLPEDYDKEQGIVRVISIGDFDHNPCCGTHMSQTSHIGLILVHHGIPINATRQRLYFSAGDRAIAISTASINAIRSIAKITMAPPAKPTETVASVQRLSDDMARLRKEKQGLRLEIAKIETEKVLALLKNGKNAWVYKPGEQLTFSAMIWAELRDSLKNHPGQVVVVATGEGSDDGTISVLGDRDAVARVARQIQDILHGLRGGGKGERWQARVTKWEKGQLEALQKLINT